MSIYNKDKVYKELSSQLEDYTKLLAALNNIERVSKKDGTDFAIISKNIKNAFYDTADSKYPTLTVYYSNTYHYIWCYQFLDEKIKGYENKGILRDTYILNVDEIFQEIEKDKVRIAGFIESYRKQLIDAEKMIEKANKIINSINSFLSSENLRDGYNKNTLGYALEDYIKDSIR